MTLASIRHKYYLPKSYSTVQHILHKFCFHCRKRRAKPLKQPIIATIPDYRLVEGDQPFSHTGIDIFGLCLVFEKWPRKDPFFSYYSNSSHTSQSTQKSLLEMRERKKIFALIFTYLAIRATYIVPVTSLDTRNIWAAFESFMADCHVLPKTIVSDNAAQFRTIEDSNPTFWTTVPTTYPFKQHCFKHSINWKFIPA